MNVKGYELVGDWNPSNIGHTAIAEKDGKRYFLKRYGEYKMPRHDRSTTEALYSRLMTEFEGFRNNRVAINETLKEFTASGGNIVAPADWFEEDIFYIEANEFVDGVIDDEDVLKLSKEEKLFIMLTAVGALCAIHRKKIVHSDLKRTNILVAKKDGGRRLVAKIIDFDRSYFADKVRPVELGGDFNFMSPELAQCIMMGCTEDGDLTEEMEQAISYLSTKSDIFSLGLVFHDYLTGGEHPKLDGLTGPIKEKVDMGKTVYCSEALLSGGQLVVSDKIEDSYLRHLIAAMLQLEPEDRPTAQEVLETLKTKSVLALKPGSPIRIEGESTEPPAETAATETAAADETRKVAPTGFCAPWEEHKIAFDPEKMLHSGYVASEQVDHRGTKCYALYKADGNKRIFTLETLLILSMASRVGSDGTPVSRETSRGSEVSVPTVEITVYDDGTLWESDSAYQFDAAAIQKAGYLGAARAERKGTKGYALIKNAETKRFVNLNILKQLGFVVEK